MGAASCGSCFLWELLLVGAASCGSCFLWEPLVVGAACCGSSALRAMCSWSAGKSRTGCSSHKYRVHRAQGAAPTNTGCIAHRVRLPQIQGAIAHGVRLLQRQLPQNAPVGAAPCARWPAGAPCTLKPKPHPNADTNRFSPPSPPAPDWPRHTVPKPAGLLLGARHGRKSPAATPASPAGAC